MLSFEKSQQDPSCDSPQLIKAQELALSDQTKLDLLPKSPLHQTPLSNFSIRDYVLYARSKDIKTNWPFSLKSLQVCLRQGVKEILPPFQPLDSSRKLSCLSNPGACEVVSSCISALGNGFPSTTSVCHSEVELVPTNRQSSPLLETDLFESSAEAEAEAAEVGPSRRKTGSIVGARIKKSRLSVKLGSNTHRSSSEVIGSNYTAVSDTMVLKVCPVCKTFSSTSNTTLNAHIDQCLSGESTSRNNANSSLPRNKIKPRKTKLMTDIYATAKPCTLEDLDRRNGSNWASIQATPVESTETSAEAKNHAVPLPPTHCEDNGISGNVYIDSNGIKLRILSKSNDLPLASEVVEDVGPSKQLEGSKFSQTRKKRPHAEIEQHRKHVKLTHQSKKFRSSIGNNSPVLENDGKCSQAEGSNQRDDGAESSNLERLNALGTLQRWVGSKRTALTKKVSKKSGLEAFRLNVNVARKLRVEGDQPKGPKLPDRITSSEKAKRIVYSAKETESNDRKEQSLGRKRTRSHSGKMADRTIRSHSPSKRNASLTNKWCTSIGDVHMLKPPNPTGNNEALLDKQRTGNHAGCFEGLHISPCAREKIMKSCPASVTKVTKTCTSRNKLSSDSQSSTPKSKSNVILKPSAFKKSQVNLITEVDDTVSCQFKAERQDTSGGSHLEKQPGRKKCMSKLSLVRDSVVAVSTYSRERNIGSERQLSGFCNAGSGETVSSVLINDDFSSKSDGPESARNECTMQGNNIVPESLPEAVAMKYKTQPNSVRSFGNYEGLLHEGETLNGTAEFSFIDREMFLARNCVRNIGGLNARGEGEQDSEFGLENTHPEVDPIPIPGPPGSFLPSPRAVGSEDENFQGNSLMKTWAVRYSQDKHDMMIKRNSSYSPVSSKSTVSNPMAGGSERKHADTTDPDESIAARDKVNYLGLSCATIEPLSGDAAPPPSAISINTENDSFEGEIKFYKIHDKRGTQGGNNDEKPCCCEWKESTFQNISPNYNDSGLLRRGAMPKNLAFHLLEKQPGYCADTKAKNFEAVPKMLQMRNYSSSILENMHSPVTEDPTYANLLRGASNAGMKVTGQGDSSSVSQSSSPNTVLRLMGKNLIVVNKDWDAPMPLGQDERGAQNNHCSSQYATSTGFSLISIPHQGCISTQDSSSSLGLCSNVRMSSEFRSQDGQVETPEKTSARIVHNQLTHGSFAACLEACHYKDEHSTCNQEFQHKRRSFESTSYVSKNSSEMSDSVLRNADQFKLTRDINITADCPGYAADLKIDARNAGDLRNYQEVSSGMSILPAHHNMMRSNAFPCFHSLDPSRLSLHQWSTRLALP